MSCHWYILQETKAQLATTTKKLNQAREEGEQIRSDLKTMITQYQVSETVCQSMSSMDCGGGQESEEMRSNSLDVKLKETEKELKAHEQEIADQQELHTLTVKELELAKAAHSIAVTECQQLKTKVSPTIPHPTLYHLFHLLSFFPVLPRCQNRVFIWQRSGASWTN